jgi:hypothetical protein
MTIDIVMISNAPGGDGTNWRAGQTYTAADDFARALIGRGDAYAADQSLGDIGLNATQVRAIQSLFGVDGARVVIPDVIKTEKLTALEMDAYLQGIIDAASAAYDPLLGRVRIAFPTAVWNITRLRWRGNVWYDFGGAIFTQDAVLGNPNAAMIDCVRTIVTGSTYYGNHRNIKITGGTFVSNGAAAGSNVVQMFEFEDFEVIDFTVQHTTGRNNWAWAVAGRRGTIINPRVLGGVEVYQDGLHIFRGDNIAVTGGYIEAGDDCCVCGADYTDVSQADDDEGITNVTFTGVAVRSERGFGCSIYYGQDTYGFAGTYRRKIRNVQMIGIVGKAGQARNGGVRIISTSAAGSPGTDNTVVSDCTIQASLDVGGASHDGAQAFGVHVTTGVRNVIDVSLAITDSTGAATRFRPFYVTSTDGTKITLRQSGDVELAPQLVPFSSSHTVKNVKITGGDLRAANVDGRYGVTLSNNVGGTMDANEVTENDIRNIRDGGYGVLAEGSTTVGVLRVDNNRYYKRAGATTSSGYNGAATTATTHLELNGNDFSGVDTGSPGNLFAANHTSFNVSGNRGFPNRQAGTATIASGATSVVVNITGAAVRFSETSDAASSQIKITPTNFPTNTVGARVSITSTTSFTITLSGDPGASGATFSWAIDTGKKPV